MLKKNKIEKIEMLKNIVKKSKLGKNPKVETYNRHLNFLLFPIRFYVSICRKSIYISLV